MGVIHAVLVRLSDAILDQSTEDLIEEARGEAETVTERQPLSTTDAHALGLPDDVVLGQTHPADLLRLLDVWAEKPLEAALDALTEAQRAWSGRAARVGLNAEFELDATWLRRCWQSSRRSVMGPNQADREEARERAAWHLEKALQLVRGVYLVESGFFSGPDGSPHLMDTTLAAVRATPERYALVFFMYHG